MGSVSEKHESGCVWADICIVYMGAGVEWNISSVKMCVGVCIPDGCCS